MFLTLAFCLRKNCQLLIFLFFFLLMMEYYGIYYIQSHILFGASAFPAFKYIYIFLVVIYFLF